jgi:thiol-disulfide isomerase/thioredoxin
MEVALSVARIVLAAVFALAAVTKLADLDGARNAARDFGVPERLAPAVGTLLPVAELAAALLLLPAATAVAGAALALALLLAFTTAIAVSLARGETPDCHCFGQLHSAPAGPATLIRNGALAALAAFVLVGSLAEEPAGAFGWIGDLTGTETVAVGLGAALAAVAAAGVAAFLTLLRSYGTVLVRVERLEGALRDAGLRIDESPQLGLEPGTPAPAFELDGADGANLSLADLLEPRRPLLLLFTASGCPPCEELMPDVDRWQAEHADRLTVATVAELDVHRAYEAAGTPSGVLVASDGTIATWVAAGPPAIRSLVREVLDAPGLPIGAPAPRLDDLEPLDGARPAFGERELLLMFWNPDCGFCRGMHEELMAWEEDANGTSPQLVVISSGDRDRTAGDGFRSPVLLDPDWATGTAFGASGTPSAIAIDAHGRVDSEVLVGAEPILARLSGPRLVQVDGGA